MGLIARVTSNGKASNCTRHSRVLLTLPVLVMFMMQFHKIFSRRFSKILSRPLFERAVVKAVITDTRLITVRIPVNNRTSYDYIPNRIGT